MAQVFMRFPGGKMRTLTFSYDDGVEQDQRLVEIFQKHGLRATFNLNSGEYAPEGTVYPKGQIHRRMTRAAVSELYRKDGIEVAVHGFTPVAGSSSSQYVYQGSDEGQGGAGGTVFNNRTGYGISLRHLFR